MYIQAVLFDQDGTTIYSPKEMILECVAGTLETLGKAPEGCEGDIHRFWFGADRDNVIRHCFELEPRVFWDEFRGRDNVDLRKKYVSPYPDSTTAIRRLKERGLKLGIITGARQDIAEYQAGLIGEGVFNEIIAARPDCGIKGKPDPEGLLLCLDRLGVKKNQSVYVGNGQEDLEAAENAGMRFVLVDRGEIKLNGINPFIPRIRSLEQLPELLERMLPVTAP